MSKRKNKKGEMIVKIDLEKAYDHIDWDFLEDILKTVGIQPHILQVIRSCFSTTNMSILWNGTQLAGFKSSKGLRQGDPLSPYLFVLYMEVLGQQIQQAVDRKQWRASHVGKGKTENLSSLLCGRFVIVR